MKRIRLFARLRIIARRRPIIFLLVVLFTIGLAIVILEQYVWGRAANRFFLLLFSAEGFLWTWYQEGVRWPGALGLLILADIVSFSFDYFVTRQLLFVPRVRMVVHVVWNACKNSWYFIRGKTADYDLVNQTSVKDGSWNPIANWMSSIKRDPSKANLRVVRIIAATPRVFTVVIGGTAIAIFLVRYNNYGKKGIRAVLEGMAIRTIGTVLFYELIFEWIP